jgi:hypothetical protein
MNYGKSIIVTVCGLVVFLLFVFYQELKLTDGGFTRSSQVATILPLVIQAGVSLLAFWGVMLVFKFRELSLTRSDLIKSLWEIGFKRDELSIEIAKAKEDGETQGLLMKLYEELGKDAKIRKKAIGEYYESETVTLYIGLLGAAFLVGSIGSGLYGISMTFHAEMVDAFTYFAPILSLFVGAMLTIAALLISSFRLTEELEIR